jgi:hypothetical protein
MTKQQTPATNRRLDRIYLTRVDAKRIAEKPHRFDRVMVEAAQRALIDAPDSDPDAIDALRALHQHLTRDWGRDDGTTYRWDRADQLFSVTWSSLGQVRQHSQRSIFTAMRDHGLTEAVDRVGDRYIVS